MSCMIEPSCKGMTLEKLREVANSCYQRNQRRCQENPRPASCNTKPIHSKSTRKSVCRWLRYNPEIRTTTDLSKQDFLERDKRLIKKDSQFLERFLGNYVCEFRKNTLDIRDIVYLLQLYGKDPIHKVYLPPCNLKRKYTERDFNVTWNGGEENGKGHLYFPYHFPNILTKFRKETRNKSGNPWLVFPMTIFSEEVEEYHSNLLIYYPKLQVVERIEPTGYRFGYYDQRELDNRLENYFHKLDIQYLRTIDNLPRQGIAVLEAIESSALTLDKKDDPEGFCQTWTYFYLDQKFRHPNLSTQKLFDYIIDTIMDSDYTFLEVIRYFHGIVNKFTQDTFNELGYKEEKDIDDWFLNNYKYIMNRLGFC